MPEIKFVEKQYEGKLHVQFDEGEWRKLLSILHWLETKEPSLLKALARSI